MMGTGTQLGSTLKPGAPAKSVGGAKSSQSAKLGDDRQLRGRPPASWLLFGALLFVSVAFAEDDWGFDLQVYGWLPIIELELENGSKTKVTRHDILDNLDMTALWAASIRKGRWSLASDFVYLGISDEADLPLLPNVPGGVTIRKAGFDAWIVTPNVAYTVVSSDRQKIDLYAGARYFRIEFDVKLVIDPIIPGEPSTSRKESPSVSSWDGIVGARGLVYLSDKWIIPYSASVGTGESDFTWSGQAGFGYRYNTFDAVFGWRIQNYDVGSDTLIKELDLSGPFAGAIFRW